MLKQIDKTLSYNYEFYLCRRDTREPIATLKHGYNICNVSYKAEYRNIDELNFEIPYFVRDKKMKIITNPIWDLVKADMIIEMIVSMGDDEIFTQYFIVNSPQKVGSGESKKKVVHCYGYEQSLNNIKIRMFQGTRQLYLSPSETVETGQGILNLLEEKTYGDWKVGYISPSAMNENISGQNHRKYRTFNVSDKSWLDFIRTELELSFDCVFEFTYDKIQNCNLINVYSTDEYGQDQGLYISEKNYIDKLTEEPNIDELVTRLTILGKDNLTINSVNLGRGYIEDMSYYRNLDYMSQELLNAFNTYDSLVEQKTPIFQGYLNQIKDLTSQLNTKSNEMASLKSQMSILQDNKDIAISQGLDQSSINAQINSKQTEINTKQGEIDSINSQITTVTNNINTLNNDIKLENNFTQEQLKIINKYLREAVWSNENYYEVNSLLEAGKKAQKKMNEPLLNLSVELPSFIDIVECQYDWKKLKIGDVIYCEYTLWNDFFQTRIVGYTHDITNKTLKIDLSNRDFKYDSQRYISELSKEVSNTSNVVGSYRNIWDTALGSGNWINQIVSDGIDATNYAINSVHNGQEITLDERGIKLASSNDVGLIRMINNLIALSADGQNFETAITPNGILTKKLIGEILLTTQLYIANEANNVSINKDGIIIKNDSGVTIITPNQINASAITTGTLDASKITVVNLDAGSITTGTIDASKISVTNLNANNITSGKLDSNYINVHDLSADSITTGTLKVGGQWVTSKGTIYANSNGLYNNFGGSNNSYRSLAYANYGSLPNPSGSSGYTITLPDVFKGKHFDITIALSGFESYQASSTNMYIYVDGEPNYSNGTFNIIGTGTTSNVSQILFTYIAIA